MKSFKKLLNAQLHNNIPEPKSSPEPAPVSATGKKETELKKPNAPWYKTEEHFL